MNLDSYMLPCINKKYLGIECPGCGIQRAVSLLLEGDFLAAFHMYPAIYTILILLGFVGINLFISIKNSLKIKIFLLYLNAAIIFISYIIKMTHIIH
ncbi:Protein of unknown function [Arenibacter nanhaiticus]|uniref:DUF2752 domain-containing protein n=1 Tax=Arenibacter nanhaiticus TaxID=558155 RepID=A0A1M6MT84_9FLAO|nr:DUF2752 domain-containing protein [Arenibacter nanhaiticus]SHJ86600.1 Protein of unknown function [Arenibacter nanhaiticus]